MVNLRKSVQFELFEQDAIGGCDEMFVRSDAWKPWVDVLTSELVIQKQSACNLSLHYPNHISYQGVSWEMFRF